MAKRRITPEEQLLNLIEKKDKPGAVKFKRRRSFLLGFANLESLRLSLGRGIKQSFDVFKSGLREPNLKVLNKFFFIFSFVLLSYSIAGFVFGRPSIENVYEKIQIPQEKELEEKVTPPARPFLHYLNMVRRRNIFNPVELKEPEKAEVKEKRLQEIAKDLSLVGISWDKEPIAMIEDRAAKKTYFLKKGDSINKFKLDDILIDRVILILEGERIELM